LNIGKFLPANVNSKKGFTRMGAFWFCVMIVLTFLILGSNFLTDRVSLEEGEIAPSNVYYFGTATTFVSQVYTKQAQDMAASEVEQVYKYDDTVVGNMQQQVDELFDSLHNVRVSGNDDDVRLQELAELLTPAAEGQDEAAADSEAPSQAVLEYYLDLDEVSETYLRNCLKNAVVAAYGMGEFSEDALSEVVAQCDSNIKATTQSSGSENFLLQAAKMLVFKPTHVFDQVATMEAITQAIDSVQPISTTVYPGQQVITRGHEVTAADIETLEAVGLQQQGSSIKSYLGLALLVLICYVLLQLYCTRMSGDNNLGVQNINLISLLFIAILLVARIITMVKFESDLATDWMLGLAIPVPAFAMLVAALVNKRTAIFSTLIVSIFIGIMCGAHMLYIFAALVGGLVGVLQVSNMGSRGRYAFAVFNISVAYILVTISWCFMWNYDNSAIGIGILMSVINGVVSVILTVGALPLLESVFSITTEVRLMELSNINHPLLKKLMIEAPGTYNHSILVGNLAEAAADQIGANGLLVRVAAYFHDIGKVKRPNFFIENQKPGENPHDKLKPSLSVFIITSHTKEGADIARSYNLPVEIIDIIEQHHGTSLVKGFYNKALEAAKDTELESTVREEDFRYPGPIPQSREAALVMLADSCQAAVQSMAAPTPGQIEGMVREVIKGKFDEGQLSNCALTFRDLDIIASTFATILAGAKHYRMPYPEQLAKELAKVKKQALEEIAKENKETNKETEKDSKDSKDFKESKENGERSADKSEKK
jgi:hypothetical protein